MIDVYEKDGDLVVNVRVIPRSSRSEIAGAHDGMLRVRLTSPPVDNAANTELIRLLSKHFGVSKSDIEIISGETSKNKRIKIGNLSQSSFEELIL